MDSGSQIHAQKERAVITIVMYSIWTSRNILTRGEAAFNPVKSMKFIRETLQTFEVDCTVLVQNWKNHDVDRSLIKPVSDEISKLSECLLSFSVLFSPVREVNQVAHCFAKFVCIHKESLSWNTEPPNFIVHNLEADCNFVGLS
jgi:hypothetical protein